MFKKKNKPPKPVKKKIKLILVCGSGIASSTLVYPMVEDLLRDNGYDYEILKGTFNDVKNYMDLDMVMTTLTYLPQEVIDLNIPIITVTTLLKGDYETIGTIVEEVKKVMGDD